MSVSISACFVLQLLFYSYLDFRLVDSKGIIEVQLKQKECEILIRKKEALPQMNITTAPVSTAQFSFPQPMVQPQMPPAPAPPPAASAAPALPPPAPAKAKSSHPPLKCPMAGTFYRSPAPSAPPFVKVSYYHCFQV